MLIGNGLIAKGFEAYINNDNFLLFASGVSNSKEININEFDRELNLIKFYINNEKTKKFIYFSTCSIYDTGLKNSLYICHKLSIEKYISDNCKNFIIFRLPNVVGNIGNKNTFFNYFKNCILENREIIIYKNATRYLIDILDIKTLLPFFIESLDIKNKIINVAFNNKMSILDIVNIFESILKSNTKKKIINAGNDYDINNNYFLQNSNITIDNNYNYNLINKYLIIKQF
jgi:nucleoside-diphosphate-sugar epimerase